MSTPAILVTGAARRVGHALASDLGAHGWRVAIHYATGAEEAKALAEAINDRAPTRDRAYIFQADLSDEAAVESLIPRVTATMGPLTALVNNASLFERDDIESMTRESWDRHLDINLRAPLVLTQHFARQAPDQGAAVVNIIDQRVWRLTPRFLSYTISKAALWTATQTLAQALAPRIRVNAIGPGPTLANARQSAADFARQAQGTLLRRGAHVDDICAALRYLLSAPAVTGQMIAVDGGQHLAWETPDLKDIDE